MCVLVCVRGCVPAAQWFVAYLSPELQQYAVTSAFEAYTRSQPGLAAALGLDSVHM